MCLIIVFRHRLTLLVKNGLTTPTGGLARDIPEDRRLRCRSRAVALFGAPGNQPPPPLVSRCEPRGLGGGGLTRLNFDLPRAITQPRPLDRRRCFARCNRYIRGLSMADHTHICQPRPRVSLGADRRAFLHPSVLWGAWQASRSKVGVAWRGWVWFSRVGVAWAKVGVALKIRR